MEGRYRGRDGVSVKGVEIWTTRNYCCWNSENKKIGVEHLIISKKSLPMIKF